MEKLNLFVNCPNYVIVRDTPAGTIAISGSFKYKDKALKALKEKIDYINKYPLGLKAPGWGDPYLMELTVNMNIVESTVKPNIVDTLKTLDFSVVVQDSYRACSERCSADWPTSSMIAEDIVDNYEGYKDVDLSTPDKYNKWISEVQIELNRQGLVYKEDE